MGSYATTRKFIFLTSGTVAKYDGGMIVGGCC